MARRVSANVPKFKTIERSLREILKAQHDTAVRLREAKADAYERVCLDRAAEACDQATKDIREALHRLYDAFDRPSRR